MPCGNVGQTAVMAYYFAVMGMEGQYSWRTMLALLRMACIAWRVPDCCGSVMLCDQGKLMTRTLLVQCTALQRTALPQKRLAYVYEEIRT